MPDLLENNTDRNCVLKGLLTVWQWKMWVERKEMSVIISDLSHVSVWNIIQEVCSIVLSGDLRVSITFSFIWVTPPIVSLISKYKSTVYCVVSQAHFTRPKYVLYTKHIWFFFFCCIVVINVFFVMVRLRVLLVERWDGLLIHSCAWGLTVAFVGVLAVASEASVQCSCFATLCSSHNAVLCTRGCRVRLAERDTDRAKQKQNACLGIWPLCSCLICIPYQWTTKAT